MTDVLRDILGLSTGTIATLTGQSSYAANDAIQETWITYELENPSSEDGQIEWQQSWQHFAASEAYQQMMVGFAIPSRTQPLDVYGVKIDYNRE